MSQEPLWSWSAADLARAMAAGELSAREVMLSTLERVDAVNPTLNAIVDKLSGEALAAADQADARRARGEALGPLHGVPVTIKSNVAQQGRAVTNGVVAFRDNIAAEDAPVVANLRRAGAILFGRTNVPAFSWRWFTDNELFGTTVNPLDPTITCGGSSGGAAVAVATGMGPLAHGSDLAGSIRHPAACCGIFGLKPSHGIIPNFDPGAPERPILSQLMVTQGPLARDLDDLRLGFSAMLGRDARDPWYTGPRDGAARRRTGKIGIYPPPEDGADAGIVDGLQVAARQLADGGYDVTQAPIPAVADCLSLYQALLGEARLGLFERIEQLGDQHVRNTARALQRFAPALDLAGYAGALAMRSRFVGAWKTLLDEYDAILAPVSWRMPFDVEADQRGDPTVIDIATSLLPTIASNLSGLPALAFPGTSHTKPVGLQLIGQHLDDDALFGIAAHCSKGVSPIFAL